MNPHLTAGLCYDVVSVDVGLITPRKATSSAATLAAQILGAGERRAGNASPQIQSQSKVREFTECDSRSMALPVQEKSNAPKVRKAEFVRDGYGNRNPGNGRLVDTEFADTSGSRPKFDFIRLPAVSLSVIADSLGPLIQRGQGNLRWARIL